MRYLPHATGVLQKYWNRPLIWPALARLTVEFCHHRLRPSAKRELLDRKAKDREQARDWCQQHTISRDEIGRALDLELTIEDPEQLFPDVFAGAHSRVQNSPVSLGGAGNLELLYSLTKSLQAKECIETGVAFGWSSLAILLAIHHQPDAKLSSIDLPYIELRNDDFVGLAVPEELKRNWSLYRMADREGIPLILRKTSEIDLAHYDSDKTYQGRMFSYSRLWDALRPGGLLISDDISDNLAFADFAKSVDRFPVVVKDGNKFQGVVRK